MLKSDICADSGEKNKPDAELKPVSAQIDNVLMTNVQRMWQNIFIFFGLGFSSILI